MSNLKYYNDSTGQWEYLVIGKQGPTGATGATGSDGALSPNYIINGAFDIWQRGTSFSGSINSNYTADRWRYNVDTSTSGMTATVSQEEFTPDELNAIGFGDAKYYLRMTVDTVGSSTGQKMENKIEDVRTLAGQIATLSFWARSQTITSLGIQTVQFFAGGSVPNLTGHGSIDIGTSWQRHAITFTVPSIAGKTIGTNGDSQLVARILGDSMTDGDEFDLWGVQLEAGSIATPFKRNANSIQGELAACQRYYYTRAGQNQEPIGSGQMDTTTKAFVMVFFPVQMRTVPSMEATGDFLMRQGNKNGVATTLTISSNVKSTKGAVVIGEDTIAAGFNQSGGVNIWNGTSAAYLAFDAEL